MFIHTSTCILASCSYTRKCCCILFAATISCQGWSTTGRQGIVPHVPQKLLAMVARAFSAVIPLLVYLGNLLHTCSLPASSDATPRLPPPGVTPLADDPAELGISRKSTLSTQFEPLASWFHAVWADTYLFTLTDLGNTSTLTQPLHWWVSSASSDTFSTWRNSTSTQPILTTTDAGTPESSFQWAASASKGSSNPMPPRWERILVFTTHRISRPYGLTSETCWVSPNSDTRHQGTGGRRRNLLQRIHHHLRGSIHLRPTARICAKLPSWPPEVRHLSPYGKHPGRPRILAPQLPSLRTTSFVLVDWPPWRRTERNLLCGSNGSAHHLLSIPTLSPSLPAHCMNFVL